MQKEFLAPIDEGGKLQNEYNLTNPNLAATYTIKGGSRRAEKSRKVLMMMMKTAKLGWAGPGAGQKQSRSGVEA